MKKNRYFLVILVLVVAGFVYSLRESRRAPAGDPPVDPAAPSEIWFEEVAQARGIDFRHRSGHEERYLIPESVSGGAGFFDADGDGDLDIYLVQSGSLTDASKRRPGNQLYENLGDGTFRNITAGSGAEDEGYGMGVACGDYDNDGDVDLYVTNQGPNALLQNRGGGQFTNVTAEAGVGHPGWGASSGFFDYDRDGDLDLFVANYIEWSMEIEERCGRGDRDYCGPGSYGVPARDVLYRNEGDGTFTDVTEAAGLGEDFGNGLGVVFGDFNQDGWLDIFVATDALPDQLWINQQDGTFVDEATEYGCAMGEHGSPEAGMGTAAADVNQDGALDLIVGNFVGETDSFYLNEGGAFSDRTAEAGLGVITRGFNRFGLGWADINNDTFLDLYVANGRIMKESSTYTDDPYAEPNLLFRGTAGPPEPHFREVTPRGGTAALLPAASRAAAFGDFDNDGGIDVLVANRDERAFLMRNVVRDSGHWINFQVLDEHGKASEGVRLEVQAGDRIRYGQVRSAFSFLSCNDPRVHFGLGEATRIDEVRVHWLDGTSNTYGPFDSDQILTLRHPPGVGS